MNLSIRQIVFLRVTSFCMHHLFPCPMFSLWAHSWVHRPPDVNFHHLKFACTCNTLRRDSHRSSIWFGDGWCIHFILLSCFLVICSLSEHSVPWNPRFPMLSNIPTLLRLKLKCSMVWPLCICKYSIPLSYVVVLGMSLIWIFLIHGCLWHCIMITLWGWKISPLLCCM